MSELYIKRELAWRNHLLKLFIAYREATLDYFEGASKGHNNGVAKVERANDRLDEYDMDEILEQITRRRKR